MPILKRPGAEIFYDVAIDPEQVDSRPWITLINGHTRTSNDFKLMTKFLVGKGLNVLTLDNRGCGKTEVSESFTGQDMVDDVVAIWNHKGVTKSSILGVSMGGMIAQYIALRYASMVTSAILASTTSHRKYIISSRTPWEPDLDAVKTKLSRYFAPSFAAKNKLLIDAMAKNTVRSMEGGRFQKGVEQQTLAMASFDDPADFSELKMPFLILHGEEDQVIGVEAAYEFGEKIKQAEVKTYPGVGHLILAEAPQQLYKDVEEFLARHGQLA